MQQQCMDEFSKEIVLVDPEFRSPVTECSRSDFFVMFDFVFICNPIYMSPFGAGFGTCGDFPSGCQRINEPVLLPLLYKSKTNLTRIVIDGANIKQKKWIIQIFLRKKQLLLILYKIN